MKVTVFEGSTEDIISKVKESDSNLFKVAVVEDIGPRSERLLPIGSDRIWSNWVTTHQNGPYPTKMGP